MDTIPFIKEILSKPFLRVFLSHTYASKGYLQGLDPGHTEDVKLQTIQYIKSRSRKLGIKRREIFDPSSKCTDWWSHRGMRDDKRNLDHWVYKLVSRNYLGHIKVAGELENKVDIDAVINSLYDIKSMEDLLLPNADSSNRHLTNDEKSVAILLITAIPALRELKDPYKMLRFLLELTTELDNLPEQIAQACEGQPQALLLIGSLLSAKPRAYETWKRVKDDLVKIKESNNGASSDNHMLHIYTYCYDDLSFFLRACFLYLACYPMNYEIPARSLTEIWIADEFVEEHDGETAEETAYKYLEQLVQRSLVCVSKRSISGAIKCCRVSQHSIHKFCIKKSHEGKFLVANPTNEQEMASVNRLAFHNDHKKQYTEGEFKDNWDYSDVYYVLCFDLNMNVLGKNILGQIDYPDVLELRKCTIPHTFLPDIHRYYDIKYLGLRGSNISELPENIWAFRKLKTLDVRDTNIKTLPESLWNIKTLRHVYVNPSLSIKGPPLTANIDGLHILKTVMVHETWLENFPQFLSNLRKLALSNRDNPDSKPNPYWKSISNLLSRMVNLLSMTIIGDIVPSEFVDIRAFPNLKTVKSIKFEGEWISRKLFIDHVKFPPNLVKLTLTKSRLKEDPMSRLERLQALKYLSLQDGAYTGMKMICSANGFPQLRFLELFKLENLEIWEVKPMAMSQLTTLRVDQCLKLKNPPNLEHVTDKNPANLEHVTDKHNIVLELPEEEGPTADSELVPSSLTSITPILQVANEIEQENPRIAYLCRFHAFEKAHKLDPYPTGRDVKQFKRYLIYRLEKDEGDTLPTLGRTYPREMQKFYQHYYEKHLRDGSARRSPDEMAKHYHIASILYDVLKAVVPYEKIESQVENYAREVERNRLNFAQAWSTILSFQVSSPPPPIMEFSGIRAAVNALCNLGDLPMTRAANQTTVHVEANHGPGQEVDYVE